jgi:DNA-binding NtrC family response regulator
MPGLSGPQLAEHLQPLRPEMKVLYMSGYPDAAKANSALEPRTDFIEKPFTQNKLLHRLREVLEGGTLSS